MTGYVMKGSELMDNALREVGFVEGVVCRRLSCVWDSCVVAEWTTLSKVGWKLSFCSCCYVSDAV